MPEETLSITIGNTPQNNTYAVLIEPDDYHFIQKIPQKEVEKNIQNYMQRQISSVLSIVIPNLLKARDAIALQLDLAMENITEEYFENEIKNYVTNVEKVNRRKLANNAAAIMRWTKRPYTAEEIATMFNCSLEDSEEAVSAIINGYKIEEV